MSQQLKYQDRNLLPSALINFDLLPDSAYIRLPVMTVLYGVSESSIWRGVRNGTIPSMVLIIQLMIMVNLWEKFGFGKLRITLFS